MMEGISRLVRRKDGTLGPFDGKEEKLAKLVLGVLGRGAGYGISYNALIEGGDAIGINLRNVSPQQIMGDKLVAKAVHEAYGQAPHPHKFKAGSKEAQEALTKTLDTIYERGRKE